MKITSQFIAAIAFALLPLSALAADASPPPGAVPAEVLSKLHHANQMEIEAGKLAQEKGQSKGVKDFGKLLVKDHTAADKKVTALAKQLNVELTTPPDANHGKMDAAKNAEGAAFDKAFAEAMVEDHAKDVSEASAARDATTEPKLKRLLTQLVPTLEKHHKVAQKLANSSQANPPAPGSVK